MKIVLTGTIKQIGDIQTFGSGFEKLEAIVTIDEAEKYPQDIKVEFVKERIQNLDPYKAGDKVSIDAYLKGSEYKGRYFVNINGSKVTRLQAGQGNVTPPNEGGGNDEVPF